MSLEAGWRGPCFDICFIAREASADRDAFLASILLNVSRVEVSPAVYLLAAAVGLHELRERDLKAGAAAAACCAASLRFGAEGWCFREGPVELYSGCEAPIESLRGLALELAAPAPCAVLLSSWPVLWKPFREFPVPNAPERSATENALTTGAWSWALRL